MKKTSKIKTFYVLPPGMMLMHVLKIQKQAQEDGVDPVKAVGEWAQTAALELAAQTNETSVEFTAQIQRLTNKRMAHQGGAPRGNRNAAKSAKTGEKREEKESLNNKNSTSVRKGAKVEHLLDDFSREKGPEKNQGCFEVVLENPEKCPETVAIPGYAGQNDENQPSEKSNKNNSGPKKFAKSAPGCFENGARLFQKSPEVVFQNRAKNGENIAKSGKNPQTDESEKQPVVLKKSTSTRKSAGEKEKEKEKRKNTPPPTSSPSSDLTIEVATAKLAEQGYTKEEVRRSWGYYARLGWCNTKGAPIPPRLRLNRLALWIDDARRRPREEEEEVRSAPRKSAPPPANRDERKGWIIGRRGA